MSSQKTLKAEEIYSKKITALKQKMILIEKYKAIIEKDRLLHYPKDQYPVFNVQFANLLVALAEFWPREFSYPKDETMLFNGYLANEKDNTYEFVNLQTTYNKLLLVRSHEMYPCSTLEIEARKKHDRNFINATSFPFVKLSIEGELTCKRYPSVVPLHSSMVAHQGNVFNYEVNPEKIHDFLLLVLNKKISEIKQNLKAHVLGLFQEISAKTHSYRMLELATELQKIKNNL